MIAQRQLALLAGAPRYQYPHSARPLVELFDAGRQQWRKAQSIAGWEGETAETARALFSSNERDATKIRDQMVRSVALVEDANRAMDQAARRFAALPPAEISLSLLTNVARGTQVEVSGYGVLESPIHLLNYAHWLFREREQAAHEALDEFRLTIDSLTAQLRDMGGSATAALIQSATQVRPSQTRPSLEEILEQYQVSDDPDGLTKWPGWPLSMFTDPKTMTQTEAEMLSRLGIVELFLLEDIRNQAFAEADARIATDDQNDDHNDAFRHAYWNARMSALMGDEWAEGFATAHEASPDNVLSAREAMDLYNNQVGREIAAANPHASDQELADLIEEALEAGHLVVIDKNGDLQWSDRVARGDTGEPSPDAGLRPGNPELDDIVEDAGGS